VSESCKKCAGRYHTLLHKDNQNGKDTTSLEVSLISALDQPTVLLETAFVYVRDRAGCMQPVCALVDFASQISFMSDSCVEQFGPKMDRPSYRLIWG